MSKDFRTAVQDRRSIYGLGREVAISDEKILDVIRHAVKFSPTAFHSQSGRVIVLFQKSHEKLWDITKTILKNRVSEDQFARTEEKINSFRSAYGTVLYFEDQTVIEGLQKQFPAYQENFPIWSQQSSGMLQYVIWTGLEAEGLGVSLQHYNPLIDDEVRKEFDVPASWKLIAQMPFGAPTAKAGEKQFQSVEERIKIFK